MINIKNLQETFDDDTITTLIEMAKGSMNENINLIKTSLKNKDIKQIYCGCHTLKSLGFLGVYTIVTQADILSDLTRDLYSFNKLNLEEFLEHFKILEEQCELFKKNY